MEDHMSEELDSVKKTLNFYVDLVENNTSNVQLYLAENVVLDWFGKTVKGSKKVSLFIKDQVSEVTHQIANTNPSEKVGFREIHNVKVIKNSQERIVFAVNNGLTTPPKQNQASTSTIEMGQGDGVHNCTVASPPKKMKFSEGEDEEEEGTETVESETEISQLKYLTGEGTVEFHRPSIKKLQTETRWKRPVKLHLGYTTSSIKDYTIYLIIYEGNLRCRRNLYKEFCESAKNAG